MHRSTALTAFAALGLTVIAGLSAATVTIDHGATSAPPASVQYVDQNGNPVAAPGSATANATESSASAPDRTSTPVVRNTGDDEPSEGGED
ncbi:MAG TPA: hypothetical protein VID94_11570 [Acidimicrobiales bacterium]